MLVADRVKYVRHRGVIAAARVVFVFAQRLDEVVLALAGQAWNVLITGIISLMAEVAAVLLDEGAGTVHAAGIDRSIERFRRRKL